MSGNNRHKKKRRSKGKGTAKQRSGPGVVSHLFGFKLRPDVRESFVDWVEQSEFVDEPGESEFVARIAEMALELIGAERPGFAPMAWTPDDAHVLWDIMEDLEANQQVDAEVGGQAIADAMGNATFALLLFLGDSGHWAGTEADLDHCLDDLDPQGGSHSAGPEHLSADTVSPRLVEPEIELAALTVVPVVAHLSELVEWLGDGKAVTASGVLRPADATELAGILAIDLPPGKLRTMLDIAELRRLWSVAQWVRLVDVRSTRVRPGVNVTRWHSRDLDLFRTAVAESVKAVFVDHNARPALFQADLLVVQFLLAGMTDKPLAFPLDLPADAPTQVQVIGVLVEQTLQEFADEGLVMLDDAVVVPEPLVHAVHSGLRVVESQFREVLPDWVDDAPVGDDLTIPDVTNAAEIVLRIELSGCIPAVWRRVHVASTLSLAHLHRVIQLVFGWDDCHLHEFVDGPPYSHAPTYLPAANLAMREVDGEAHPEESVLVGDLLATSGRTLTYLYDFGDDWIHKITVESVGATATVPARCVAGEGMTPFEDCGGPHGWEMLVKAVNDPTDPEHEELRQWAGIRKNQRLDPSQFDLDLADAVLRRAWDEGAS